MQAASFLFLEVTKGRDKFDTTVLDTTVPLPKLAPKAKPPPVH